MAWKIDEMVKAATDFAVEIARPVDYKVILYNDDYTTKEYVVQILQSMFHKKSTDAVSIMELVHNTGAAVVGVYSFDIAATLSNRVMSDARANGFPLRCEMECA